MPRPELLGPKRVRSLVSLLRPLPHSPTQLTGVALGPGEAHPIFDFCDEASVKAAADAFVAVGLKDAGYTGFHLDGTLLFLSHIPLPFLLAHSPVPAESVHTHTHTTQTTQPHAQHPHAHTPPYAHITLTPTDCWANVDRNASGYLLGETDHFPNGMKPVVDYVHEKGMDLYVVRQRKRWSVLHLVCVICRGVRWWWWWW